MKKLCMSLLCVTFFPFFGLAQQILGSDFDKQWVELTPWWRSSSSTTSSSSAPVGTTPAADISNSGIITIYWKVSNIQCSNNTNNSLILGEKSKTPYGGTGYSVYLKNKKCNWLGNRIEPAYISLGTPWSGSSYSSSDKDKDRDFGTWNGRQFTFRPDAVSFVYKTESDIDCPTLILYSYINKSTSIRWTQASVPADIKINGTAYKYTMPNRDCNVLGITTFQGGAVTATGNPVRISKLIERLPFQSEWTEKSVEIPYESEDAPTHINIIFSAGEYYTLDQKEGAALHLDNVNLVYYSRLASLSVNGMPVPDFSPDTFEYTMAADMPVNEGEISAECLGNSNSGEAEVALSPEESKVYVTVTNKNKDVTGADESELRDIDGKTSHQYTILFAKSSTITDIGAAKEEDARYFDLRGIEVEKSALTPGLYIRRTGNTSTKVIVK